MTDLTRVFLGWNGPLLPGVAGWLLEHEARLGEVVVVVAGTPPGIEGATNTIRMHRVGAGARG